jgi:hypothetical protein
MKGAPMHFLRPIVGYGIMAIIIIKIPQKD